MSVIVAMVDEHRAVMAADRRVSFGTYYRDTETKVFRRGDMLVGVAGNPVASKFVRAYRGYKAEGCYTALQWAEGLAQDLFNALREQGHGSADGGILIHPIELLFATPGFVADGGGYGGVCVAADHAAVGSGAPYALGVLQDVDGPFTDQCGRAVGAAIALDSACGGLVDMVVLNDREEGANV